MTTGRSRLRAAAAATLSALLLTTGCQNTEATPADAAPPAAGTGTAVTAEEPVAEPPAHSFVSATCDGLGTLLTDMLGFGNGLPSTASGFPDDPAVVQDIVARGVAAHQEFTARTAAARDALAAAEGPNFEGAAEFEQRVHTALQQVEQSLQGIGTGLAGVDPTAPGNTSDAMIAIYSIGLAAFPLGVILIDNPTMATRVDPETVAQVVARSPGSLGFYEEARDVPSCAALLAEYDTAELDALLSAAEN